MTYEWAKGRSKDADAQAVGERLAVLAQEFPKLPPDVVVDDARAPASPLHPCFEWDDSKAAHQHRLAQARQLVSCIVAAPMRGATPVRVFINIAAREEEDDTQGYMTRVQVMGDEELRREALLAALGRAFGNIRDLSNEPEMRGVVRAIEAARARLTAKLERAA